MRLIQSITNKLKTNMSVDSKDKTYELENVGVCICVPVYTI